MLRKYIGYLCYSLLLLFPVTALKAQIWPTQVNTIIVPPYSPFTGDYVNTPGKMIVNLLLRDINASNVKVKLRITIEGQGTGVRLTTNPQANVPPITLDGGIPVRLTDADLAPYFKVENLILNGITPAQYNSGGGKLPEDLYKICFEAYEQFSGAKISISNGCGNAWIILNDPPFLNTPSNAVKVPVRVPGVVSFQWTPRHKGSPNSAFSTSYLFQLVELMPGAYTNPQAAFLSSVPLYETTTSSTMLVYGMMGEVPLEPGRNYAWRVKAISTSGVQEMDLFKNQGFSEIFSFTYAGDCPVPTNVTAEAKGNSRINVSWQTSGTTQQEFIVSYRKAGVADAVWFDEKTTATNVTIIDLEPSTTYEYKVRAACGTEGESNFSAIDTVSTPAETPVDYSCGLISVSGDINNMQPLEQLKARDQISAGLFKVKLTEVTGSGGNFSGKGYIAVPFLKNAKLEVTFENILVNTDYELARGVILTAYDPKWSGVNDLDKYFEGGGNTGKVVTGKDSVTLEVDVVIPGPDNINVTLTPGDSTSAARLTIIGADGTEVTRTVSSLPATIKDKEGNIYNVDDKGNVTKVASGGKSFLPNAGELNVLHPDVAVVKFMAHEEQAYAFDAWDATYLRSMLFAAEYEKLSDNYYVSAKAIGAGKADIVSAEITTAKDINKDSVKFVSAKGVCYESKRRDNTNIYEIKILGGPANDAQELYAVYAPPGAKPITLGKLLIVAYEELKRKVVLVPVNGDPVNREDISSTLQRIYGRVSVNWEVVVDNPFTDTRWDLNGDSLLDVGSGGLLGTRTREMKQLSQLYTATGKVNSDAVYLFILRNGKDKDKLIAGDMPRNQQFGYIFTGAGADIGKTIAHELGHGAFHLRHTFDGYGFAEAELKDNLMNYKEGERLTKFQWNAVHDPGIVWGIFETDGDGELTAPAESVKLTENQPFVTPDGYLIMLPKGAEILHSCKYEDLMRIGALYKFKDKGKVWEHNTLWNSGGGNFDGYVSTSGETYQPSLVSTKALKTVCQVIQRTDGGKVMLKVEKATLKVEVPLRPASLDGSQRTKDMIRDNVLSSYEVGQYSATACTAAAELDAELDKQVDAMKAMAGRLNSQWDVEFDGGTGKKHVHQGGPNSKGKVTYKFENGKWTATVKLDEKKIQRRGNPKYYHEGDLKETEKAIQEAINAKLDKFKPGKDGKSNIPATTTESIHTEDGGEFNFGKGVGWGQWGSVIMDAGVEIYQEAALPKTYWKQDDPKYEGYPVHAPPTLAGVGDGVIDEVTAIPQLVKLGVTVVTDKEVAIGIWNSVSKISLSSIRDAAVGGVKEKWDKYANSPGFITYHEMGKDGVQVASMAFGGFAKNGKNLAEAVTETGEQIGKKAVKKADWDLVRRYMKHIKEMTGLEVHPKQFEYLKEALRNKEYKKMTAEEVKKHRKKFSKALKDKCIAEWEKETGQIWPRYTEDILDSAGEIARKKGAPYDAHHIIENQVGGDHKWWNMHPAKFPDEHQGGIHGAGSPGNELFQ